MNEKKIRNKKNSAAFPSLIYVLSAPSGGGKTTLCRKIVKSVPNLVCSVSLTTRLPRCGEKDGKDYFFVSKEEFVRKVKKGDLVEWAMVHGCYYGTPKHFLEGFLKKGTNVILDIDVQGGIVIKKKYPLNTVLIFIIPPSIEVLEKRLRDRKKDSENTIKLRLENAKKEFKAIKKYDFVLINDDLKSSLRMLENIIQSEQMKKEVVLLNTDIENFFNKER